MLTLRCSSGKNSNINSIIDRIDDIEGAKTVSIDSIAVRYGFGNDEEFENATYIVDDAKSIFDILVK